MKYEDLIARMENIESYLAGEISFAEARRRLAEIKLRQAPADDDEGNNGHGLH